MRQDGEATIEEQDYIDADKFNQIEKLMKLRFYGQYKDDLPGFVDKLRLIKNAKNHGPPAVVDVGSVANAFSPTADAAADNQAYDQFMQDSERFDIEIQYQLKMKMNDKEMYTKLQKSDLLKPSMSENVMFRNQVENLDDTVRILEKDNEWLLNVGNLGKETAKDDDQFDKQKYLALKADIKRRKEAKQRIL